MRLEDVNKTILISQLGGDIELVKQTQFLLARYGYLDPPVDGKFGPTSNWALTEFAYRKGMSIGQGLSPELAKALLDTKHETLPTLSESGTWFDKVIEYMVRKEYWICRHPEAWNIVYLEGVDPNGKLNKNKPNQFNDLRVIFSISATGAPVFTVWEGTTEPGLFWTMTPMSQKGAARIAFNQYKSWSIGTHHPGKASAHEALVQVEPILVYRDLNKDFNRQGDETEFGLFAINQHWGYNAPKDDLGQTSAGCLVGRTKAGHLEFMSMVKSDPRYLANSTYRFITTVLPGTEVLG
ncbi:peptidoglycan-binding domain-containing protein [Rhizobium ruizarguesonis]|uniref:peptidoglycan-binding domain-containing protein n=1 Tax=Rhizobium ruizarguesonis TaxID=2081791 RepID=UPI00102F4F05|nr:peptidoglycan-binding domain-containing protein [Rhizobium ruizarguesonis]TBC68725.1 peptidoglycan-binding protein [Rhizobium ruizarguesonis]